MLTHRTAIPASSLWVVAIFGSACAGTWSDVTLIGRSFPPLGECAPVQVFPTTPPPYSWENVAFDQAICGVVEPSFCIKTLEQDARRVGADTVFGIHEGFINDTHRAYGGFRTEKVMSATLARRVGGPTPDAVCSTSATPRQSSP